MLAETKKRVAGQTATEIKEEVKTMTQTLDDVVQTFVAGSTFKDKRGNYILHADKNSFVAMKNTELILKTLERLDGRLAAVEKQLKESV